MTIKSILLFFLKPAALFFLSIWSMLLLPVAESKGQCVTIDSVRFTNVLCFGTNTATVTVYTSGGAAPYGYLLQRLTGTGFVIAGTSFGNPSNVHTFTGLSAGNNYFVTVADDDATCSAVISSFFNISQPPALNLAITTQTNILDCAGNSSGSFVLNATGGTAPYEYSINGGSFAASNTFSNLGAGTYTLTVRDANACLRTINGTLTEPNAVQITLVSQINVVCFGAASGQLVLSATGGTAPFSYSLNGGPFQASATFNNLAAGTYTAVARDASNCTDTLLATITQPAGGVTISIDAQNNITCNGASNGSITVSASGGAAPYLFSLNGGAFSATNAFTGLAPGSYQILVQDSGGCTDTANITLTEPPVLNLNILSQTNNLCFEDATGAVTLGATGGTAPYAFSFNGGPFGPSAAFTSLNGGIYTAIVRDANNCTDTVIVTITPPIPLDVVVSAQANITCFGESSGSFSVLGSGGTAPYTFSFQNGVFAGSTTFTNLSAGSYKVVIRDVNNCTDSIFINITQPAVALDVALNAQVNPLCNGAANGQIQVTASGGTAPYQFSLNGGAFGASATFNSLLAGTYVIRVRDASACIDSVQVILTQPLALDVTVSAQTNVQCFGETSGAITLAGSGGTAPYQFALNGGAFGAVATFTGLTQGSYTGRIQDANGCVDTVTVVLTSPAELIASITTQANVLCFGEATGSVTFQAVGGTPGYQFSFQGGAFSAVNSVNNLTAGSYTIIARDANGCRDTIVATITQPAAVLDIPIVAQTNVLCFGAATGSVSVGATGGTAPYQYSFQGGAFQAGNNFTGLTAGAYVIRVRDVNACIDSVIATIIQPATAVDVQIASQTNVLCAGDASGAINVTGFGGTAPYQFRLNSGAFSATSNFTGLLAGTYLITIRDANNCIDTISVNLTQPTALDVTVQSQINNLCFGDASGSVTLQGSGGVAPYQFALNAGVFGPSPTFTNLVGGNYIGRITDVNGCVDTVSFTIVPAIPLDIAITAQNNVLCFGEVNGSITVAGSGGTAPYQFALNGGAFAASNTFNGLTAGNYTIVIRDANNCLDSINTTLTQPAVALDVALNAQVNPLCNGAANGQIQVTASGGTAPYQFSLNGGAFGPSSTFNSLLAGTYVIRVRDASACIDSVQVILTQPLALDVTVSAQTNVQCFGETSGAITLAGSGGTAPYQFALNGGAFGAVATFTGLTQGSYTGRIQDSNGCVDTVTVVLTSPAELIASITTQTNVLCFGEATGSVSFQAVGGTPGYQFSFQGGAFSAVNSVINLTAGSYTIIARDANGCRDTIVATITQPAAVLDIPIVAQTNVLCFGAATGSVSVGATGGTAPYQYSFQGGAFQAGNNFTGLTAGAYVIRVLDANACIDSVIATITQPATAVDVQIASQTNVLCAGDASGAINVTGSGGTAPYQFRLNSGAFSATSNFTGLLAGSYLITIRDANNCIDTISVNLTQPTALDVTVQSQINNLCFGDASGSVTLQGSGGVAPYQFALNAGSFGPSPTFTNLVGGNYIGRITDANGCVDTISFVISPPSPLDITIAAQNNVLCFGEVNGSITVAGSGGTAPYQFALNGGAFAASNTFNGLTAGNYTIVIRDANNCLDSINTALTQPAVALDITLSNQSNLSCNGDNSGSISVSATGGTAPYQFSLNGGAFGALANFNGLSAGAYTIVVRDAANCQDSITLTLTQPDSLLASLTSKTDILCFGDNNGTAAIGVSGGRVPYQFSLNGAPFQSGSSFANLSGGNYVVVVRDSSGCTDTVLFTINPVTALSISVVSQVNVSCFGAATGSATVRGNGGTAPYLYSLQGSSFVSDTVFTNLAAGAYSVVIRDANNCLDSLVINISQPAAGVSATLISQTNIACFGETSGALSVTASNGTSPYQFSLNSGVFQASGLFTNLSAGAYFVVVQDANGCTDTLFATLTGPSSLIDLTLSNQTNILCFGDSTGIIGVNATGGTAPYEYNLNGGAFAALSTFSALPAGSYTILARDANGCADSLSVALTEPSSAVNASIVTTANALCFGDNSGILTVSGSGGIVPYQFSLNGGAFQTSGTFAGLSAGSYTITVRDANNCTGSGIGFVGQPASALSISTSSQTNVSCFGGNNGSVVLSASGGTSPYQFSFNGGAFGALSSFSNLIAGSYTVVVRDANNCQNTETVVITQPASALTASIASQTNVLCNGAATGSVTVSAIGGTAPYTYAIDGVNFGPSSTFNGLSFSSYIITVRDANACTQVLNVNISQPATSITFNATGVDPSSCTTNDGQVVISGVNGGTAPYTFSIDGITFGATSTFTGLSNGTYFAFVRDANGCTVNSIVSISSSDGLTAVVNTTPVSCFGASDGQIIIDSVAGGNGTYRYAIDGVTFQTSPIFNNLAAGNYIVTVRDTPFSCSLILNVAITQPSALDLNIVTLQNNLCKDGNSGSVTFSSTGGSGPFTYAIQSGAFVTDSVFGNLSAGSYIGRVRDANGCEDSITFNISEPAVNVSLSVSNLSAPFCAGDSSGSVTVLATGGTAPYEYSLNGGLFGSSNVFSGLPAGNYSITVRDANLCDSTIQIIIVPTATLAAAIANVLQPGCNGSSDGSIEVNASGGTAPYTFSINAGPFVASNIFSSLGSGNYTLTVRDANGCTVTIDTVLVNPAPIGLISTAIVPVLCFGDSTGSVSLSASGGNAPYEFSLDGVSFVSSAAFNGLIAGSYTFTVRDANSCTQTLSVVVPGPSMGLFFTTNTVSSTCFGSATGEISINASGGTAPYAYSLDGVNFVSTSVFSGLSPSNYTVFVRDANNCVNSNAVLVGGPTTAITFTTNSVVPTSCVLSNGSITIDSVSGGLAPYSYSLNGTTFSITPNFTGLASGVYTVFVRDSNNCVANTQSVNLVAPSGITSTPVLVDPTCFGGNNGSIVLASNQGGSGVFEFNLNGGAFSSDSVFSGLSAGSYTVIVRDVPFSCQSVFTIILTDPLPVQVSFLNVINALCSGDSSGSITVTGIGGTAPYSYSLNGGSGQLVGTFSGLPAGAYAITVTDSLGCSATDSLIIDNSTPSPIISTSLSDPSCFGDSDGQVTYAVTGTTGPYQFSLNGGLSQSNPVFTGLSAGVYSVLVIDTNGCQFGRTDFLTQPDSITITLQLSNVSGCGGSNGTVIVRATGGTAPYQYRLNGGALVSTDTFINLAAGNYTLEVIDANLCSNSRSFVLNASGNITGSVFQTPVLCNGVANGQALVFNVTGGSGTYQYSLDNITYQGNPIFSGLSLGFYTIFVRDAIDTLCISTFPITIAAQFTVSGLVIVTGSSCSAADGSISFDISGGLAPYTYSIDSGATFASNTLFTGLAGGIYHLVVRDSNNCTFERTVSVPGAPVITPFVSLVSQVTCAAFPDGSIRVDSVSGSTGPFLYSINGIDFSASSQFSGLSAGTYILSVQDIGSGCIATDTVEILGAPLLSLSATITREPSCSGVAGGRVLLSANGGLGSYLYKMDTLGFGPSTFFGNVMAGTRQFIVQDSLGCTDTLAIIVGVDTIKASLVVTPLTNCSSNDGIIKVAIITSGIPPYTFALNGGAPTLIDSFPNLLPGFYMVTITDSAGCSSDFEATIPPVSTLTANAEFDKTACINSATGLISVYGIVGGSAPYLYSLDGINFQLDSVFDNLASGLYTVTVKSADSCTVQISGQINEPDSLVGFISFQQNVTCRGTSNGIVDVNAAGGSPGYRYSLDGITFTLSDLFTGLSAGAGVITVSDSNDCQINIPFTITEPDSITYDLSVTPANTCNAATGIATITNVQGGFAPYEFSIDGGITFVDTSVFGGLSSGSYTLLVRDSVGCLYTSQFVVNVPGGIQLGLNQMIQPTCFGSNDGQIRLGLITGGLAPYQFSIDAGVTFGNDSIFSNLVSFLYNVVIRDANNCTYSFIFNLGQPSNINFNVSQQKPATCDSANGIGIVNGVIGGITPYEYQINFDNRPFQASPIFENLPAGNYLVTVRDATGICEITKLLVIDGNPGITYDFEVTDATCYGGTNGRIRIFNIQGGLSPYRVSLDTTGIPFTIADQANSVTFNNLTPAIYQMQIRDQEGCIYRLPALEVEQPDSIMFSVQNVQPSRKDSAEGALFIHDIVGGGAPYRYSLNGVNYFEILPSDNSFEYSQLIKNLAPGNYTVFIQDDKGCRSTVQTVVYTYQFATRFEIPNVFTPNGDGVNDTFFINRLPSKSQIKIYSRNGRLIYSSDDYQNDWDGDQYPEGTYFYSMTVPNVGDFVGWVEIWR